jgi:hypothetical protein
MKQGVETMITRVANYVGWAAYLSGFAGILALVTLLLFFGLEATPSAAPGPHIWGPLSDICPIIQMLLLLVVARALYLTQRLSAPGLSLFAGVLGMVGMLGVALLQLLLRLGVIPFEQEVVAVAVATGIVGVWLIVVNHLGRIQRLVSSRLAWLGIVVGAAFFFQPILLAALGGGSFWQNIMSNYLLVAASALVFLVSYLVFPVWAIGLGRVLSGVGRQSGLQPNAQGIVGTRVQ